MYFVKLINMFLIVLISTFIGINKSKLFELRVIKLRNLKSSFNLFKSKIEFTYEPIREIFSEVSKVVYDDKSNIFKSYLINLENDNYENSWSLAVAENSYGFSKEDIQIVSGFGKMLGKTDLKGQLNEIELANVFLDKQILDAEENKKKNDKLYKSLGVIVGLGIVIILI